MNNYIDSTIEKNIIGLSSNHHTWKSPLAISLVSLLRTKKRILQLGFYQKPIWRKKQNPLANIFNFLLCTQEKLLFIKRDLYHRHIFYFFSLVFFFLGNIKKHLLSYMNKKTTVTFANGKWTCACWKVHDGYPCHCFSCKKDVITSPKFPDRTL